MPVAAELVRYVAQPIILLNPAMGTLYKFRTFENAYHIRMVEHNELWFAPPAQFNDPFDCNIPMRLDKCPESWLREQMVAYALTQDPTISETEAKEKVDEELRESGGPGHRRALRWHQFTETVSPTVGVLSLARHWNREGAELMWSHYSNSHSGFAVGFDEEALLSWMKSVSGIPQDAKRYEAVEGMNIRPAPVEYVEDMPMVVPCEDEPSEAVYKLVTHKSTAWEYEDEIRYLMMSFDSDFSLQPLSLDDRTQCIFVSGGWHAKQFGCILAVVPTSFPRR